MKRILSFLFFIPLMSAAQKIAVIDRNFYQPIKMMDALTTEVAIKGGLIVYQKDIALVIEGLEQLVKKISYGKKLPDEFGDIRFGNTRCIIIPRKRGNKYCYNILLNTSSQGITTSIILADGEMNKRALQRLYIFIDYLRHNISATKSNL